MMKACMFFSVLLSGAVVLHRMGHYFSDNPVTFLAVCIVVAVIFTYTYSPMLDRNKAFSWLMIAGMPIGAAVVQI
jgi:hypothetical protein